MGLNCQLWRSYDVTATPKSKTQYINLTVVTRPFIWAIASRRTIRMHGDIGQNVWNWHIFKLCPKMAHYLQLFLEQPYHQKMRHNALFPFRWYVGGGTASVKKVIRKKPNFYGSFNFWHILAQRKCDNRFLTTDPDWPLDGKFFGTFGFPFMFMWEKLFSLKVKKYFNFQTLLWRHSHAQIQNQPHPRMPLEKDNIWCEGHFGTPAGSKVMAKRLFWHPIFDPIFRFLAHSGATVKGTKSPFPPFSIHHIATTLPPFAIRYPFWSLCAKVPNRAHFRLPLWRHDHAQPRPISRHLWTSRRSFVWAMSQFCHFCGSKVTVQSVFLALFGTSATRFVPNNSEQKGGTPVQTKVLRYPTEFGTVWADSAVCTSCHFFAPLVWKSVKKCQNRLFWRHCDVGATPNLDAVFRKRCAPTSSTTSRKPRFDTPFRFRVIHEKPVFRPFFPPPWHMFFGVYPTLPLYPNSQISYSTRTLYRYTF